LLQQPLRLCSHFDDALRASCDVLVAICSNPGGSFVHVAEYSNGMVPKPMTLLAAICLMINLTGSCFVLAFMLVTVIVVAQEAYLGRSALLPGRFALQHLEANVARNVG
jgi:hypothetical protein